MRTEGHNLEGVGHIRNERIDPTDIQRAVQTRRADDVDLIELRDGSRPANLDVQNAVGCLRVIARDIQASRRRAGIHLAGVTQVAGDIAAALQRAALDIDFNRVARHKRAIQRRGPGGLRILLVVADGEGRPRRDVHATGVGELGDPSRRREVTAVLNRETARCRVRGEVRQPVGIGLIDDLRVGPVEHNRRGIGGDRRSGELQLAGDVERSAGQRAATEVGQLAASDVERSRVSDVDDAAITKRRRRPRLADGQIASRDVDCSAVGVIGAGAAKCCRCAHIHESAVRQLGGESSASASTRSEVDGARVVERTSTDRQVGRRRAASHRFQRDDPGVVETVGGGECGRAVGVISLDQDRLGRRDIAGEHATATGREFGRSVGPVADIQRRGGQTRRSRDYAAVEVERGTGQIEQARGRQRSSRLRESLAGTVDGQRLSRRDVEGVIVDVAAAGLRERRAGVEVHGPVVGEVGGDRARTPASRVDVNDAAGGVRQRAAGHRQIRGGRAAADCLQRDVAGITEIARRRQRGRAVGGIALHADDLAGSHIAAEIGAAANRELRSSVRIVADVQGGARQPGRPRDRAAVEVECGAIAQVEQRGRSQQVQRASVLMKGLTGAVDGQRLAVRQVEVAVVGVAAAGFRERRGLVQVHRAVVDQVGRDRAAATRARVDVDDPGGRVGQRFRRVRDGQIGIAGGLDGLQRDRSGVVEPIRGRQRGGTVRRIALDPNLLAWCDIAAEIATATD